MSETLCTLRTKGGGGGEQYNETVLWTNPSPSSNFATQTITLSDSLDNYEYVGVSWAYSTSAQTGSNTNREVMLVEDFKKAIEPASTTRTNPIIGSRGTNSTYARSAFYVSSTQVLFGNAFALNATGTSNAYSIPLQVVGIQKSGGSKPNTVHGTGTMSTSATTKVTLNFRPDFIVLECTKGTAEVRLVYDSAYGSSIQRLCSISSGGTAQYVKDSYPPTSTAGTRVSLIEDDGFTITKLSQGNYDAYGADFAYIAGKYEV